MNLTQLTSQILQQAITLAEQKEAVQARIAEIDRQLAALLGGAPAEQGVAPVTNVKAGRKVKTGKRGQVKEAIIGVLKNAGQKGIGLQDISKALGKNSNSVRVWLASARKRIKEIKKLGRGIYGWRV